MTLRIINTFTTNEKLLVTTQQRSTRSPRVDALQNRAKILGVAIKQFQIHGTGASLEAIAKEAGVGVGTLYRHFPQRDDLIAAVLQTREAALNQVIEQLDTQTNASEVLQLWMESLSDYLTSFDGLIDPMGRALMSTESALSISCDWLLRTTERYLAAAKSAEIVRTDVSSRDLFLLVLASSWITRSVIADAKSLSSVKSVIWNGLQNRRNL